MNERFIARHGAEARFQFRFLAGMFFGLGAFGLGLSVSVDLLLQRRCIGLVRLQTGDGFLRFFQRIVRRIEVGLQFLAAALGFADVLTVDVEQRRNLFVGRVLEQFCDVLTFHVFSSLFGFSFFARRLSAWP